jgi:hypothetical protein
LAKKAEAATSSFRDGETYSNVIIRIAKSEVRGCDGHRPAAAGEGRFGHNCLIYLPEVKGGLMSIDPLIAGGVVLTTALTDAIYVQFTAAVAARRRYAAASWSSLWYLLAAFAVISYTSNWVYVLFAAVGSWIGGFLSITALNRAALSRPGEGRGAPHGGGPT